jgi:signal transduction histidine kinase
MIAQGQAPKVVVIDDEIGPRESLRILLKDQYDVHTAGSVREGMRLLAEYRPDTVVMDIRMPGRSGIEGLRDIRSIDPHVSVVMLTGYAVLETAQEALRLGANDYLKKPFDTAEMRKVIGTNVARTQVERRRATVARDLSELSLRLSAELAGKERMASLGQISSELVHDIRNPLTVVQGFVDLLNRQLESSKDGTGRPSDEALRYLAVIEKNVKQCHELLETWQSFGKREPCSWETVSVAELVQDVVEGAAAMAERVGAELRTEPVEGQCVVVGDRTQLWRAVQNVVKNAIEALRAPGGKVSVGCRRTGGVVEIRVTDTGAGMTAEELHRVFEPYYSTKAPGKGMGLGLFITRKVIEDHRGVVTVESKPDEGTTMVIRLPVAPAADSTAVAVSEAAEVQALTAAQR